LNKTFFVTDIEVIDLETDQQQPAVAAAQVAPTPAAADPAPQLPPAQPRRGRRRRGQAVDAPTPARRGRTSTTEGESNRARPTRSTARHAFYGNGDSDDDFVDP